MRSRILDSATRMLVDSGYASLSMRKLAQAIGYSATTIYHHFDSKDDLFHALVEEGMSRLSDVLREALAACTGTESGVRLRSLCHAYVTFGLQNPEYYEVMFVAAPPSLERFPIDKYRRARGNLDLFATVLADVAVETKHRARPLDTRRDATTIWAMLHGIVSLVNARRVDRRVDIDGLVGDSVARVVDMYAPSDVMP